MSVIGKAIQRFKFQPAPASTVRRSRHDGRSSVKHSRAMRTYNIVRRVAAVWVAALIILMPVAATVAQNETADTTEGADISETTEGLEAPGAPGEPVDLTNPLSVLQSAGRALPFDRDGDGAEDDPFADHDGLSATLSIIMLLTVLSLAPALLVMVTSFTRIVIVLALLRQALGTQGLPPSQVVVGLALFMTFLVMAPTFERMNNEALMPLQAGEINELQAWERAKQPLRDFMFAQIEHADNWDDVYMILNYRGIDTSEPETLQRRDVDMLTLVPSFILSELKIAFLIGFRIYLPFLVIDMVVASVLISMGMLMLPPVLISLPFKLLLFVLVDGWMLVAGNLLNSFAVPGVTT